MRQLTLAFLSFLIALIIISFTSNAQTDFTFCYGSIAVTIHGGGKAEMVRYNSSGKIVSRVNGEFGLYGVGSPTELLKITFQGEEFRYDLIRDGFGNPSVIIDVAGRRYTVCKSGGIRENTNSTTMPDMSNLKLILPQAGSRTGYKLKRNSSNSYTVINLKTNKSEFEFITQSKNDENQISKLYYENAISLVENIKNGQNINGRLPNFDELEIIYSLKQQLADYNLYSTSWSSTKSEKNPVFGVKGIDFKTGDILEGSKATRTYLQPDRFTVGNTFIVIDKNIEEKKDNVSIKINGNNKIMILLNGLPLTETYKVGYPIEHIKEMNNKAFKGFRNWRLPSIEELRIIFNDKNILDELDNFDPRDEFWTSTYAGGRDDNRKGNKYYTKRQSDGQEWNNAGDFNYSPAYWYKASLILVRDDFSETKNNDVEYCGDFFVPKGYSIKDAKIYQKSGKLIFSYDDLNQNKITHRERPLIEDEKNKDLYFLNEYKSEDLNFVRENGKIVSAKLSTPGLDVTLTKNVTKNDTSKENTNSEIANDKLINYFNIGLEKYQIKNYDGAEIDFLESIRLNTNALEAGFYAGMIKVIYNDYQNAITYFDKVIENSKNNNKFYSGALANRGISKFMLGAKDKAKEDLEKACSLSENQACDVLKLYK